jgi:hypothetical protein
MCQTRADESGSWFGIAPNEVKALATALTIRPPIGVIAPSPAPLTPSGLRCGATAAMTDFAAVFPPSRVEAARMQRTITPEYKGRRFPTCRHEPSRAGFGCSRRVGPYYFPRARGAGRRRPQTARFRPHGTPGCPRLQFVADSLVGRETDSNPRSPVYGELGARGPRATSSASDLRYVWGGFHVDKAGLELEIEHLAASLFSLVAREVASILSEPTH